ncbi:MAG TPA: hypothetical protein VE421_12035 [Burkholderiaceae bacterium]|nr:hypothetical protein [Burkholderiaceae bacterium]
MKIYKWASGLVFAASFGAAAQVPVIISPGIAGDPMEAIGSIGDAGLPGTGALKKLLTVPANRIFRLTDLSLGTRFANTSANTCIVEVVRGTETGPTQLAWSRVKLSSGSTYDRSWHTPPTFAAGEVIWLRAFFDPFETGVRLCARTDVTRQSEVTYALRGYLTRAGH